MLRFRILNLFACVVLTGFNAALGIWPMVAMNITLFVINLWHIRKLVAPGTTSRPTSCSRWVPTTSTSVTCCASTVLTS